MQVGSTGGELDPEIPSPKHPSAVGESAVVFLGTRR